MPLRSCRLTSSVIALLFACIIHTVLSEAQTSVKTDIDRLAAGIEKTVVGWRRDFHEHPELSNREFRTAEIVAEHLRELGIEVRTGVAHTGVVGVLRGGKPGPVVALRADMDALPVTEETGLPFASTIRAEYNGDEVGVMHACGHDCHVSILMGTAQVLAALRDDLPGTVKFIFQPAEEGSPQGEDGGADLMIAEGVLEDPRPDVVFGLHVSNDFTVGQVGYRPGGAMASSDVLRITVYGSQTHGAYPWRGVDPVVTSAEIIMGLQTIVSRQLSLTTAPAVVTVTSIHGGLRSNIIPSEVKLLGTIRSLDPDMRTDIHDCVRHMATTIAEANGATADVSIGLGAPVTWNDPALTEKMLPTLHTVFGRENVILSEAHTGAEDFAYYAEKVPSLYLFLGTRSPDVAKEDVAPGHSPFFMVNEDALVYGVRMFGNMVVDYMEAM